MTEANEEGIPFQVGDWLSDEADPSRLGQYTGEHYAAGPHLMVGVRYPDQSKKSRPLRALRLVEGPTGSPDDQLDQGRFGKVRDLQRLLTFEKLKGTLHEVIYSMEAAQVDFYPYQFKPVVKFIQSPTERLVIADEVGLGKTIESMLIWTELVARRQATRLLIVCPRMLTEKWRLELRTKFMIEASVVDASDLDREIATLAERGPRHACALIASYTGLRPPRAEIGALAQVPDESEGLSLKTRLLQRLRHWPETHEPFDLVVFDEAHYMRNPGTTTFHLGESLAAAAGAVLCVSATPVNNKNADLQSLLRLIDPDFFPTQATFDALLDANRPTVFAGNALARTPVDLSRLGDAVRGMEQSPYIKNSPWFRDLQTHLPMIAAGDKRAIARCQDLVEKLNLLGGYITRTRRVQVKERRPLRESVVRPLSYSPLEQRLYDAILSLVRARCRRDGRPFHLFSVLSLQLRAASCLPALVTDLRVGAFGDKHEILVEALGEDNVDEELEAPLDDDLHSLDDLLAYDYETADSKYQELRRVLLDVVPTEKVVLFAFYRGTLRYLARRLADDGIEIAMIHGGVENSDRLAELDRFRESPTRMVLLSSEVGSEGIDLQFCRVLVNYDLPWNPMRIEQRIGRIDRVGQESQKLSIVNFKIRDTVEERLFERLHEKLERFANSLGDLEDVIGREVKDLTVQLISKELSAEQEQQLIDQSSRVLEKRLLDVQALEESGDSLLGLSDYLQDKLTADRDKGRYVQADELEDYVNDFFEREFPGCAVTRDVPAVGCWSVRLSNDAARALGRYIGTDTSLSALALRRPEFSLTFRRDVMAQLPGALRRQVTFANHQSPLIRWITSVNRERVGQFYPVSAITLRTGDVAPGFYSYRIERWKFTGLSARARLAYAVQPLGATVPAGDDLAEALVQQMRAEGQTWDYPDCDSAQLATARTALVDTLRGRFGDAATEFQNDNTTSLDIRRQRVTAMFERRIAQDQQRLETLHAAGRSPRAIQMTEGRLSTARRNYAAKLRDLERGAQVDFEQELVAIGLLHVEAP